ncbi:MAG: hypothetical protein EBR82_43740 [Caulobacteraceae bacterium]|jgi:hypothetical protein|nr:hypothetical protein [Caulobacteraceae bacterium]
MAATTIGTTGLAFGLTTETVGLVQSFSETRNIEKAEVRNNVGEIVSLSYFNPTTAYALSFAAVSNGTYLVQAGSAIAALANAATIGTTRIDSITINKSNDAFVTVDIAATGYPNIT